MISPVLNEYLTAEFDRGMSEYEVNLSKSLKRLGLRFIREVSFIGLSGDYRALRFDFALVDEHMKILGLIEYQGYQHYAKGKRTEVEFKKQQRYDRYKEVFVYKYHIPYLTIPYEIRTQSEMISYILDSNNWAYNDEDYLWHFEETSEVRLERVFNSEQFDGFIEISGWCDKTIKVYRIYKNGKVYCR